MFNKKFSKNFILDEWLSAAILDPNLVGPTLPPIPPFTLPTGPTGPTGVTGPLATNTNAFIVNFTTTVLIPCPST
ncbi:exosporium leader peptide-containing protein [Bacillus cereus]|uniref:exosporium leader peptide-containing protein n=1 Tax=Bacillus cereus TaxID=1396 RepID=UPI0024142413|nr:exosporium leader peptide-containing protein [Bacillus cereus]